jgi:hypothetical protein
MLCKVLAINYMMVSSECSQYVLMMFCPGSVPQTYGQGYGIKEDTIPNSSLLPHLISNMAEDLGLDPITYSIATEGGIKSPSRSLDMIGFSCGRLTKDSSRSYVPGSSLSTIHDGVGSWDD